MKVIEHLANATRPLVSVEVIPLHLAREPVSEDVRRTRRPFVAMMERLRPQL